MNARQLIMKKNGPRNLEALVRDSFLGKNLGATIKRDLKWVLDIEKYSTIYISSVQ